MVGLVREVERSMIWMEPEAPPLMVLLIHETD